MQRIRHGKMIRITLEISETIVISGGVKLWSNRIQSNYSDAGIRMGVKSIRDVLDDVKDARMKEMLEKCKNRHEVLQGEINKLLLEYHDEGKEPNVMAQGMSWIKTNVKLAMDDSDATIAELMTDGCDMGIKSLSRYLNQYEAADDKAKAITKKLINLENDLCSGLREYL